MQNGSTKVEAVHPVSPNRLLDESDLPAVSNPPATGVPQLAERSICLETLGYGSVLVTMSLALLAWIGVSANDALSVVVT